MINIPQEKWARFITPKCILEKRTEILRVIETLSEIEFKAILVLFRPEIRKLLKDLYYDKR